MDLNRNRHLSKLKLARADLSYAGNEAVITGYGMTWMEVIYGNEYGHTDHLLKHAKARVLSNELCQLDFKKTKIQPNVICAKLLQNEESKIPYGTCSVSSTTLIYVSLI